MHCILFKIFTEFWLTHLGLLASKLGQKASTILGAIHTVSGIMPVCQSSMA